MYQEAKLLLDKLGRQTHYVKNARIWLSDKAEMYLDALDYLESIPYSKWDSVFDNDYKGIQHKLEDATYLIQQVESWETRAEKTASLLEEVCENIKLLEKELDEFKKSEKLKGVLPKL